MKLARTWIPLVAMAALVSACQPVRTQVLLVIDTDMSVPDELDGVRVDLIGPNGEIRGSTGSITGRSDLPRTLGIVDDTGTARMVWVTVTGLRRGANVVQRRAVFTFVPNEARILRMDLLRNCVGVSCAPDETCGDNGCRSTLIGPEELEPYDPSRLGRDGGMDGGSTDGCVMQDEVCNELDDDCDGEVDEGFDLTSDMANCGRCGNACDSTPESGSSACEAGACVLRCDRGHADCNGRIDDGCEADLLAPATCGGCDVACGGATPLCQETTGGYECVDSCAEGTLECSGSCVDTSSDARHCGGCGRRCTAPPNASASCMAGDCSFECDAGFADCDGDAGNGCESRLREMDNCGRCGARCERPGAVTSCTTGTCRIVECAPGRGDCDGDPSNGCEEDLASPERCGSCTNACPSGAPNATVVCVGGRCELSCTPGFGDCDAMIGTGCEQTLTTTSACGTCGVACSDPTPLCAAVSGEGYTCTGGCGEQTTCGGSCVDVRSDPLHCGGCDTPCATAPNAIPTCEGSSCGVRCASGFGDCDGVGGNGCEQALTSSAHCGRCDNACPPRPNAVAVCSEGVCGIRCQPGFEDCNGMPEDGCEVRVDTDAANCGRCGNSCMPTAHASEVACMDGACTITACSGTREDCDGSFANGCEVDTDVNASHCGGCGNACAGSTRRCCSGMCARPNEC